MTVAAEHHLELAAETPTRQFLALLADGFASRRAYVEDPLGMPPRDCEDWGWEQHSVGVDKYEARHSNSAEFLGWVGENWLYLYPEATYRFVSTAARAAGRNFPVGLKTLLKRLEEDHLIVTDPDGHRTVNVRRGSIPPKRVIKLRRSALLASPSPAKESERE